MEKIAATVGILTFNSASTLERTLQSVRMFDEIVISDGGSTDTTVDIAKRYGTRVINQLGTHPIDFAQEKNHLLSHATHAWYLALDSDETASPELIEGIRQITSSSANQPLIYSIPMGLMFEGKDIPHFSSLPGYQTRFFSKKSGATYVKPIHERIDFPPQSVGTLTGKWYIHWNRDRLHFSSFTKYLDRDAALGAKQPLGKFIRWKIFHNLRGAAYIALYTLRSRLLYRWSECAPLKLELHKIGYKLMHVICALRFRYESPK